MNPVTHLDAAGRQRSRATPPGYRADRAPQNKGRSGAPERRSALSTDDVSR